MVSYKNLFLIKGMSAWLWLSSTLSSLRTLPSYVTGVVYRWFYPEYTTWYLFSGSLFPISYYYRYGLNTCEWKYQIDTNELIHCTNTEDNNGAEEMTYRVSWLSARTVNLTKTKDMDDFLSSLRVRGRNLDSFPSTVLLQAWSLYDKCWWSSQHNSRLEWIDAFAEEASTPCTTVYPVPVVAHRNKNKIDGEKKGI